MEDDSKLSFFFLGLGLGVAVGVLFAPKSGAETRELIRSKANEGTDYVKRRGAELRETAAETVERSKDTLRRHKENLASAVEAGKAAYRDSMNNPTTD
jgi:gas vesicle protein